MQYQGARVITFAKIIKYDQFPLLDILKDLLKIGEKSLGCPVELEFAVNLNDKNCSHEFHIYPLKLCINV